MNFEFIYSSLKVRTRIEVLLFTTVVVVDLFTREGRCYYFEDDHHGLNGCSGFVQSGMNFG